VLHDAAEFEQAAGAFRRALAIAPRYADARAHLSLSLAGAGRREEAAREAREALAARPRVTETRLAVIDALARAGLADEASRAMQELRQERPDDIGVLFASAQELRAEGKLDEAIELFRRIEARFPDNPLGPGGVGAVQMQRGEDDLARRALERALELDPYDTNALYNLGLIALRWKPPTQALAGEAAARFSRYLRMLPEDALIWMRLGQALQRLGAGVEAEAAYRRAVAITPGQPAPRRALDAFLAGDKHE
jgi:Flp pilus assembly protein TadD